MKVYLAFTLILILTACTGKKTDRPQVSGTNRVYGATVKDTPVMLNNNVQGLTTTLDKLNAHVSSYNMLKLSNRLLESDFVQAKTVGKIISDLFNVPGATATAVTSESAPPGNPYAEQVYQYLSPVLLRKFGGGLKQAKDVVTAVSQNIKMPDVPKDKTSAWYLQSIIEQLNKFNAQIVSRPSSDDSAIFLRGVSDTISTDYVKPLTDFLPKLSRRSGQSLSSFLADIQKGLGILPGLSDDEKKASARQLQEGLYYANRIEAINDSVPAFQLLIDMWFNKAQRTMLSPFIVQFFSNFTDRQLYAIITKNSPMMSVDDYDDLTKRQDFGAMSEKELLALLTFNKPVLDDKDWVQLNTPANQTAITNFMNNPTVVDLLKRIRQAGAKEGVNHFSDVAFYWLNLRFRFGLPHELISSFSQYDSREIEEMRDSGPGGLIFSWNPKRAAIRYSVIDSIENYPSGSEKPKDAAAGVRNFKEALAQKIQITVESALKAKVQALAENLGNIIQTEVSARLDRQTDGFAAQAFDYFQSYAKQSVDSWFFKGKNGALLVPSDIDFQKKDGRWTGRGNLHQTDSSALGASLANIAQLVQSPIVLGINPMDLANWSFRAVGVMASLAGYKNYSGQLIDGLTMPFFKGHEKERFDILAIQSYDPTRGLFVVPDKITLASSYQANVVESVKNPTVSVRGQMELLNAYVGMMKYLKPWVASTFDTTLKILKIDQIEDEVFPKQTLFKQSLGLALGVLINIPDNMLGLVSSDGSFVEDGNVDSPLGAALLNFDRKHKSHLIYTRDVALSILSLVDFYEVSRDIYKVDDPEIQASLQRILCDSSDPDPAEALVPEVRRACDSSSLVSARSRVHTLITGLVLFASGRLMQTDGGFVVGVNADNWNPLGEKRNLNDQLMMEKALLRAGTLLKSDAINFRAVDNFFFLNKNFWDEYASFYLEQEGSLDHRVSVENLILALDNIQKLKEFLGPFSSSSMETQKSLAQILTLGNFWEKRLLSSGVLNQSPVELAYPQYPVLNH